MIICIDGPNCCGKTTIANLIKQQLPSIIVIDDNFVKNNLIEGDYLKTRKELQKHFFDDETYLLIRWLPSMYVFDYYGDEKKFKKDSKYLVKPNLEYIILSKEDKIKERINKRENFKIAMSIEEQLKRYREYSQKFNCKLLNNEMEKDLLLIVNEILKDLI